MNEIYTVAELAIAADEDQLLSSVVERLESGDVVHSDNLVESSAGVLEGISEDAKHRLVCYALNSTDPSLSEVKELLSSGIGETARVLIKDFDRGF